MSDNRDQAILSKVANGRPLEKNEVHRYGQLSREMSQRGSNIRAFQNGQRRSPL